jgi:hypothetical protein
MNRFLEFLVGPLIASILLVLVLPIGMTQLIVTTKETFSEPTTPKIIMYVWILLALYGGIFGCFALWVLSFKNYSWILQTKSKKLKYIIFFSIGIFGANFLLSMELLKVISGEDFNYYTLLVLGPTVVCIKHLVLLISNKAG